MNAKRKILGVMAAVVGGGAVLSFFWGGSQEPQSPKQFSREKALAILLHPTDDRLALEAYASLKKEGEPVLPQLNLAYQSASNPVVRYWLLKVITEMPSSSPVVAAWVELIGFAKEERDQQLLSEALKRVSGKNFGRAGGAWKQWWETEGKVRIESAQGVDGGKKK